MALLEHRSTLLLSLLLALGVGLTACGDDDTSADDGAISGRKLGKVVATPNPISFESVGLNDETSVTVMISNTGESTLRITNISLREEAGDAPLDREQELFEDGEGWGAQDLKLEPGMVHTVRVRYHPINQSPDKGEILIASNDPSNPNYIVPITTQGVSPKIFSPATVSFPRVTPPGAGSSGENGPWRGASKITQVQNTGEAPLKITDIAIQENNSRFDFSFPRPTAEEIAEGLLPSPDNDVDELPDEYKSLDPGQSFDLRVWFAPETTNPEEAHLVFKSNDPTSPEYTVNLLGNSGSPCIEVSPAGQVDFALSSIGNISQKTVTIINCSPSSKLKLRGVEITDDGGGVYAIKDGSLPEGLPGEEVILDEGARTNFVVTFSPTREDAYSGALKIRSDDPSQTVINLALNGRGTNNACPTAVATAKVLPGGRSGTNLQALPLDTVEFDASGSSDPDGTIERYEWTILSAPAASSARIQPAGTPNPTLFMDINGEYKIELKVYDDQNTVSCGEPAIITVTVRSDTDIHIQLTWTANGIQENDLDLHYMHPNGHRWAAGSNGWDCYYNNTSPTWPGGGSPTLDIDDLFYGGPENISHSDLENVLYKIGVHYYRDYENGPAYATVEVRDRGILTFAARDKFMTNNQFWLVGFLNGRDRTVSPVDTITNGYPQ